MIGGLIILTVFVGIIVAAAIDPTNRKDHSDGIDDTDCWSL